MAETKQQRLGGGEFLIKDSQPQEVFTPEDFTEEQRMMAQATTDFIDKEVWPQKKRFEEKDYDFTFEILRKAGDMGLLGVSVPEEYGGLGMGFNSSMLICERISGASGSLSTAYGAHTGIGTLPILLYGTEEQKKKYLPKLVTGEWIGAYCLTEPGAGSDANSGSTKAELTEDGKHWVINGQKMWISNAGYANVFIVFARIEDDKNITGFIVEKGTDGLTLGEEEHKMGIHASSTRQVFFSDCKIPKDNLLGERDGGFKIAMNALNAGRIKLASATLDSNRRALTEAIKYANERKQFGRPISSFGAMRFKIAEMSARSFASESATYRAGEDIDRNIQRLIDEGVDPNEAKLRGMEEYAAECAILKVYASEVASFIADEGVQIFGGMGFSADAFMEAAYRDIRITRIYEGTNEINRMLIVGMLLRKAMKGELDLMTPAKKVAGELMSIPDFDTPDYDSPLAQEVEMLGKMKKAILMVAGKAVENLGMDIEKEQQILMNVADMIIETYVAESVLLRVQKLVSKEGKETVETQINIARLTFYSAIEKLGMAGREAVYSFTEGDEQRMLLMGLKRFTKWNEPHNPKMLRIQIAKRMIDEGRYIF